MASNIAPPPRGTGDPATDYPAVMEYLGSLYRIFVLEGLVAGNAPEVTLNDLPDPSSTNLARAQQTANQAFQLATDAKDVADTTKTLADDLDQRVGPSTTITISDTATTGEWTFAEAQPDTSYFIQATCKATSGTPAIESTLIVGIVNTTTKATLTLDVAPGSGKSVSFNLTLHRNSSS